MYYYTNTPRRYDVMCVKPFKFSTRYGTTDGAGGLRSVGKKLSVKGWIRVNYDDAAVGSRGTTGDA